MSEARIKRILVPTDFSDLATHAFDYAIELARRSGAEITVLYADTFLPPPLFTSTQLDDVADSIETSRLQAKRELESYASSRVGKIPFRALVVEDHPATAIVNVAEELDVDVIVMGTHGRSGLNRFMLGSIAERVLHETSRALLTVRAETRDVAEAARSPRFLCPVNCTDTSRAALETAMSLADLVGASLIVLHVAEDDSPESRSLVEKVRSWIPPDRMSTSVDRIVLRGDAAEQVIDYARANGADLIVLGAEHRRFADTSVLGTTTVRVTRHAPCPVLTVVSSDKESPAERKLSHA